METGDKVGKYYMSIMPLVLDILLVRTRLNTIKIFNGD